MEDTWVDRSDSTPASSKSPPAKVAPKVAHRTTRGATDGTDAAAPETPVDPTRVEPVGQTLGTPAKEHWDTKQPDPDESTAEPEKKAKTVPAPKSRPVA